MCLFYGSRFGAVMKALASHSVTPDPFVAQCHMRVEFVIGSRLAPKVFIRVLRFSSLHKKNNITNDVATSRNVKKNNFFLYGVGV